MKTPEEIALLLFRHNCHELSPEEELELAAWRSASAENEQVFRNANDPDYIRRELQSIYEGKDRVYQKIIAQYPFSDTVQKTASPRIYRLLRFAATVVISLGVIYFLGTIDIGGPPDNSGQGIDYQAALTKPDGITVVIGQLERGFADGKAAARRDLQISKGMFLMAETDPRAPANHYYTLHTAKAQQYGIQFPDSARVWLNEKSAVKYRANYSADSGKISVEGEVYVDIPKNKNARAPFLISLPNLRLATTRGLFNLRAYSRDSLVITVIDGELKLDTGSVRSAAAAVLHPSDQAQLMHGRLTVLKKVDILKPIAWRHHPRGQ